MISIAALIYQSRSYADALYASIEEFTPQLAANRAEFFFVANDATPAVRAHLKAQRYAHIVNENPKLTQQELFDAGYGIPEYINRVYRGWNEAIRRAWGDIIVLINSDMMVSPGWLEALLKELTPNRMVCSQLIEPAPAFPGAYVHALGGEPASFRAADFLKVVEEVRKPGTRPGGAYMPCAFYKSVAVAAGLYPEGNLHSGNFQAILRYGDAEFVRRLGTLGVEHVTALDSIVYHFCEGEMRKGED